MNKQRIKSNSRGIYFGIIINPKVDVVEKIDWKSLDKKSVITRYLQVDPLCLLSCPCVPEPDCFVVAGGDQLGVAGAEQNLLDALLVTLRLILQ